MCVMASSAAVLLAALLAAIPSAPASAMQLGGGTWSDCSALPLPILLPAPDCYLCLLADVNGDGVKDPVGIALNNLVVHPSLRGGGFGPPTTVRIWGIVLEAVAGDFNGDQFADVAVRRNTTNSSITIFYGGADGALHRAWWITLPPGTAYQMTAGDLDGDGLDDLAVCGGGSSVWLAWNQGTDGWSVQVVPAGANARGVGVGDLDGDGVADLAVSPAGGANGWIIRNQGSRTFSQPIPAGALRGDTISLVDLDLDGDLDRVGLLTVAGFGKRDTWCFNDGTGVFSSESTNAMNYRQRVIAGDVDADGLPDLVSCQANPGGYRMPMSITRNLGGGLFAPPVQHFMATWESEEFAAADVQGDGRIDLLEVSAVYDAMALELAAPDGTYPDALLDATSCVANTVGDWNGDGAPDIAAALFNSHALRLYVGDGRGGFAFHAQVPTELEVRSMAAADVDGDGDVDMVIASPATTGSLVQALLNDGAGQFKPGAGFFYPNGVSLLRLVDLTGDGKVDLVWVRSSPSSVVCCRGLGDGQFAEPTSWELPGTGRTQVADFNGDGLGDIAICSSSHFIAARLNDGSGNFSGVLYTNTTATTTFSAAAADMNGDGLSDLVLGSNPGAVEVWQSNGDGTFALKSSTPAMRYVRVLPLDVSGDGARDVLVGDDSFANVLYLQGAGLSLHEYARYAGPGWEFPRSVADLNGDGLADFVASDFNGIWAVVTRPVLLDADGDGIADGCGTQPCPSDLDGSGVVDGQDVGLLLGAFGSVGVAALPADVNGDRLVDGTDLALLLGAWGACPR